MASIILTFPEKLSDAVLNQQTCQFEFKDVSINHFLLAVLLMIDYMGKVDAFSREFFIEALMETIKLANQYKTQSAFEIMSRRLHD